MFGSKPAFGANAATTGGTAFPFGSTTSTAAKPLFGSTTTTTAAPSLFGSTATTTPSTSLFGAPAASTSGGLFGSTAPSTGLFGSTATSTASTGLFGSTATSTAGGGLFSKPATSGFGAATGGSLFGPKPTTGGLFGAPAAAQAAAPTRQRETLHGMITNADAVVRSLTSPELYGDERDQIIGRLNQVAAALGVGQGLYKDGQSVPYTQDGPFHRLKAIGYNTVSEFTDADGIVMLTIKSPTTELATSAQRQKLIDTLFVILGSQPNLHAKIKSVKTLPNNCCQVSIYVINRLSGTPAPSSTLVQALSEPARKQQLEAQLKVESVVSCVAMDKYQKERYLREPPAGFDDSVWMQANRENPDPKKLIPYPIRGFEQLLLRQKNQEAEVVTENQVVDSQLERLAALDTASEAASVRMASQRVTQKQLSHRLLRVLCMQLLQQRFGSGIDSTEEQIQSALETLSARLNAPQQIKPRISELMDVLRDENSLLRNNLSTAPNNTLSESDVQQLQKYLARCQDGLESLSSVVKENLRQLNNISNAIDI